MPDGEPWFGVLCCVVGTVRCVVDGLVVAVVAVVAVVCVVLLCVVVVRPPRS